MNALQRAWRKQKAVNRARNIRRFRKGRPKLGCYKCWYDCYEVEGDRCPECNAEIERDVPWWRDGRVDLWIPALLCFLYWPVQLLGPYLSSRHVLIQANTGAPIVPPWHYMLIAQALSLGFLLAGLWLVMSRTRSNRSGVFRLAVIGASMMAGMLLARAANGPLMRTLPEPGPIPTATPSPHSPLPANPASAPAP